MLLLCTVSHANATDQAYIDSLEQAISSPSSDTLQMDALMRLGFETEFSDPEKAWKCAYQWLDLAQTANNEAQLGRAYKFIGYLHEDAGAYDSAIASHWTSLAHYENAGVLSGVGACYNNIGVIYSFLGDYGLTLEYYQKSLAIDQELGNEEGVATSYNNIGSIYTNYGDFQSALVNLLLGLEMRLKLGNKAHIAASYNNIALVHSHLDEIDKALEYHFKGVALNLEMDDQIGLAKAYNNIGSAYTVKEMPDTAIMYYSRCLAIRTASHDSAAMPNVLVNVGDYWLELDSFDIAYEYLELSLAISQRLDRKHELIVSLNSLALYYLKTEQSERAVSLSERAFEAALELESLDHLRSSCEMLSKAHAAMGKHKLAYDFQIKYKEYDDAFQSEKDTKRITELNMQFNFDQQQKQDQFKNQHIRLVMQSDLDRQSLFTGISIGGLLIMLALAILIARNLAAKKKANHEISEQKQIIEEKNKDITDSIIYAHRIQEASLTSPEYLDKILPEHFVLHLPKDIVSGDFYWAYQAPNGKTFVTVADATGHGVPGAFMSMIGISLLNEIVVEKGIENVDRILDMMRAGVIKALGQKGDAGGSRDGMDMALICIDQDVVHFAGANNPLYIICEKAEEAAEENPLEKASTETHNLIELKGNKQPIGYYTRTPKPFTAQQHPIKKGDRLFMFSDGFPDQFGGIRDKKFMIASFRDLLLSITADPIGNHKQHLNGIITDWRGENEQIDDICVMGIEI
jgi:tetratricopeptide (TPR) repeat protein